MDIPRFQGFEILEVLPKGGMSTVYKARQISLDRVVAIKVLPPAMGVDPADVEKFMTEARITASLKHPNIVQVYDFGKSEDGIYYTVMEYISGYSVSAWIRRKHFLSEENSLLCSLSVAAAMKYAWQKASIVHCDIKPDNVIIDGDGTVKVADLGLARSVKSIFGKKSSDEKLVLGTPNYISPEQSRGDEDLDCRADIYSLGAMIYHCMTGTMPFEGLPPLEVMDRQITDQIPDPQDVNPRISVWSACLIEKMMAKDRSFRQKDWDEAIRDISNARSEMMPQGSLPATVVSTIRRSFKRNQQEQQDVFQPASRKRDMVPPMAISAPDGTPRPPRPFFFRKKAITCAAGAVLLVAFGWAFLHALNARKAGGTNARIAEETKIEPPSDASSPRPAPHAIPDEAERRAAEKYDGLARWVRANPTNYAGAYLRYRNLANDLKGTKYASRAKAEADKLEQNGIKGIFTQLDRKSSDLERKKRFNDAAAVYEKYDGPFSGQTRAERERRSRALRAKHEDYVRKQQVIRQTADRQLQHAADEIAWIIVEDDVLAALARMDCLASDLPAAAARPDFNGMKNLMRKSLGAEQIILDSFRLQKAQEVTVDFARGQQKVLINDVQGDVIVVDKVRLNEDGLRSMRLWKNIRLQDLSLDEKAGRLSRAGLGPETALMQTLLALKEGEYKRAVESARQTGSILADALVNAIERHSREVNEWRASSALAYILRKAGLRNENAPLPDPEACLAALRGKPPFSRGTAHKLVSIFRTRYNTTVIAQRYDKVLAMLTSSDMAGSAAIQPASPPARPDELQKSSSPATNLVVSNLIELNPGIRRDQIDLQVDESGQIVMAELVSPDLRDITPLENLGSLQRLVCAGLRKNEWSEYPVIAPLADLAPIKKMNLRELSLNNTKVKDISALGQMTLSSLNLANTRVADLAPLKTAVLASLDVSYTPVRELRSLAGAPLVYLNICGTEVYDLSPLAGAPLVFLAADSTRLRDLNAIRSLRLQHLSVRRTPVTDLLVLKEMPLEYLDVSETRVRDLAPLEGMHLRKLAIGKTDVSDISILKGMRLRELDLHDTRIRDLSALTDMPLENLNISESDVRDIAVLRSLPLKSLAMRNTGVSDLSPLVESNIEEIWLDDLYRQPNNEKNRQFMAILQRMPKLQMVNGRQFRMWQQRSFE